MRQKLALLLAGLLAVGLVGCSPAPKEEKKPSGYTVEEAQVLLDSGVFSGEMQEIDLDTLAMLYDIDRESIQSGVGYLAVNASVSADELAILVLKDEQAAQAAETACEKRLDKQLKNYQDYAPAAVPCLENAVIRRVDNTVLMAVGDPSKLPGVVDQLGN